MTMQLSPLELRRKIADVNKAFDRIDASLTKIADKEELNGIRQEMSGLLNDRLNDVRVRAATGGTGISSMGREEGRSHREIDRQAKTENRANEQNQQQPDKHIASSPAAGIQAQTERIERQDRETRRSLDDDRER
jgi:hypothetical protein